MIGVHGHGEVEVTRTMDLCSFEKKCRTAEKTLRRNRQVRAYTEADDDYTMGLVLQQAIGWFIINIII